MKVSFHPEARLELLKQKEWYRERSVSAAAGFERQFDLAISRILEGPERYPITRRGRRRFVMLDYPFDVIYRIQEHEIQIMAVAHHRRRPDYWLRRS
ncbi:MAG TPA: type II toxin-antitoxin system RelE/ParE family toxin [Thermoanaerobaculia bacterium]|jgi:plasmid stabilization system protein ParE|nr:type II toxin-antitoxin system RelE/ParE family toxin [Thermoanaerobaculia bacterium]